MAASTQVLITLDSASSPELSEQSLSNPSSTHLISLDLKYISRTQPSGSVHLGAVFGTQTYTCGVGIGHLSLT
jgi:hypothetical protein